MRKRLVMVVSSILLGVALVGQLGLFKAKAAPATFGNTTTPSLSVAAGANRKFGSVYTLPQNGTAMSFSFYAHGGTTSQKFKPAVYRTDATGKPSTLAATGSEVTVAAGQTAGWVTADLPATALSAGKYQLALLSGPNTKAASIYYEDFTGGAFFNTNNYPTPADVWGDNKKEDKKWKYYLTYLPETASAPANTEIPVIAGSAEQGEQLTVSNGTWSGQPTSHSYQWQRCQLNACDPIISAANNTYTLTAEDVGFSLKATVTAHNNQGDSQATSAASDVVMYRDREAPQTVTGLVATELSEYGLTLNWDASTDNLEVTGYRIYRDGQQLSSVSAPDTTYRDTAVISTTTYEYTVTALDAAGNESARSASTTVTVPASEDSEAPSSPTDVQASVAGDHIALTWKPSSDNRAVTRYVVERDGFDVDQSLTNGFTDTSAYPLTVYSYVIYAEDAAGNRSTGSAPVTMAVPDTTAPSVSLTSPQQDTVSGLATIAANASDAVGVAYVDFYVNDDVVFTDTEAPYSYEWDSTIVEDGPYTLKAVAYDTSDNARSTPIKTITVHNDVSAASLPGGPLLAFDARDDRVNLSNMNIGGSAMTVEAWVKSSFTSCGSTIDCRIISKANGSAEGNHWWTLGTVGVNGNPTLRFRLKLNGTTKTVGATVPLPRNQWVHVAAVYDGSAVRLYQDGTLVGTMARTGAISTDANVPAWIGGSPPGDKFWQGSIDEVRIWDTARSATQLQETKDAELLTSQPGLFAYYKLNDNLGQTVLDTSGNNRNASLGSMPTTDAADPLWTYEIYDPIPPTTPTNLTAVAQGSLQALLNWQGSTDNKAVARYIVKRDGQELARPTTTTYADNTVTPNTTYTYSVQAEDTAGNLSTPATAAVSIPPQEPLVMSDVSVGGIQSNRTTINWKTSDVGTTQVRYGATTNYSASSTLASTLTLDHSVLLQGLLPNTEYHFQVVSTNASGTYESTDFTFTTAVNAAAENGPTTYITEADLDDIIAKVQANQEPWKSNYDRLIADANEELNQIPRSVVDNGNYNPHVMLAQLVTNETDYEAALEMNESVYTLALAWRLSGDAQYGTTALALLDHWALDDDTYVDPDLRKTNGPSRHRMSITQGGFIYAADLIWGFDGWTEGQRTEFTDWVRTMGETLRYLPADNYVNDDGTLGSKNNKESWRQSLVATCGAFLQDSGMMQQAFDEFWYWLPTQIGAPGTRNAGLMIRELGRSHPEREAGSLEYSNFALHGLVMVAQIATTHGVDLYTTPVSSGASLKLALDTYVPYNVDPTTWPHGDEGMGVYERTYSYYEYAIKNIGNPAYQSVINVYGRPMKPGHGVTGNISVTYAMP